MSAPGFGGRVNKVSIKIDDLSFSWMRVGRGRLAFDIVIEIVNYINNEYSCSFRNSNSIINLNIFPISKK